MNVREKIVDAAVVEFHRGGYNGCSVDTITKAAGVPKGSFYNHFRSKEDLGAAAVARYTEQSQWEGVDPGSPVLDQLRSRFTAQRDLIEANGFTRGCLIGNMGEEAADHSLPIRTQVQASLAGWAAEIAVFIRAAQAAGEVPTDLDAEQAGRFVLDAWEGAILRVKAEKNAAAFDSFFAHVFGILFR